MHLYIIARYLAKHVLKKKKRKKKIPLRKAPSCCSLQRCLMRKLPEGLYRWALGLDWSTVVGNRFYQYGLLRSAMAMTVPPPHPPTHPLEVWLDAVRRYVGWGSFVLFSAILYAVSLFLLCDIKRRSFAKGKKTHKRLNGTVFNQTNKTELTD